MKYYKKGTQVFAFELDGSQDNLITKDMITLVGAELELIINPPLAKIELIISPWQLRKALNQLGFRDTVENLVAASTTPKDIKDGWEFASEWKEFDPTLKTMATTLGLTTSDIHSIFVIASEL